MMTFLVPRLSVFEGFVLALIFSVAFCVVGSQGAVIYSNNLDTNPGWTTSGQWAWGTPTGSAGDPASGYTGTKVYGYNLAGCYANYIFTTYWLTTRAINCSGYTGVHLKFYRWLGVESSPNDHAYIAVSNNNSTWTNVWSNPTTTINETAWSLQDLNISAYADNQATVYIRWGMGPTDSLYNYCGWNIDDVSLTGFPPPTVTSITPNSGINTGSVSITNLAGTDFQTGATVKLTKASQMNINATGVIVVSTSRITCTLNLLDAARGTWNVVVKNPDNGSNTLVNGFTVTGSVRIIYVKPTGSDSNNGLSWAQAKQTVQGGLNTAASGDQVWVAQGTYNERITLTSGASLYGGFVGNETDLSQRNFITNVTILDGQAGGSVVISPSGATVTTRFDGFTIRNGNASNGGGIYCSGSSPAISNNTISGNIASFGSGIFCSSSSPTIENCTIIGNNASAGGGGGIFCSFSSPTIHSNTISGNNASYGGGIACSSSSSPIISNNTISGNSDGGIYCDSSSPIISNNTISGNSASNGGGIGCGWSSPTIVNNTICGNNAMTSGGIYFYSSSPSIANNIIAFNGTGINKGPGSGTPVLRNNCVFNPGGADYSGLSVGTGDINEDPRLEAPEYGKYHLKPNSPCINLGNDADVQPGQVDMDGMARRYDNSTVDIGADEYDGTLYTFTPSIIRVSPAGNNANDGSSWAQAKRTVRAGIIAAAAVGGEVWVAEGTYNERSTLRAFAYLYGGFDGTETQRDQRDFKIHATILDGQQGGSVVTATALGYQLSRIDGFTIRNGTGTLSGSYRYGGGIYYSGSSPTISNNTISGNIASYGGGIYCSGSSPTISNNTISGDNASSCGGGIYCSSSSPTISNNTISGNSTPYGGGIYCFSSSPTISNNTLSGNSASYGGGIYGSGSSPTISNNTISGNSASSWGGGISCSASSPSIANNIIAFNGTGIYNDSGGTPILHSNCVFNPTYNYSGLSVGTGDIQQDPLFVGLAESDFHLTSSSPCINAGNDTDVQAGWLDMDDQPRIGGLHVDIGADEFYPLGDCDLDGYVTAADLLIVMNNMDKSEGDEGYDGQADLDGDGSITSTDLSIVLTNIE